MRIESAVFALLGEEAIYALENRLEALAAGLNELMVELFHDIKLSMMAGLNLRSCSPLWEIKLPVTCDIEINRPHSSHGVHADINFGRTQ